MENICEYCQKSFKSMYYCNTHITSCKKNPNKKITNTYTETDMLLKDKEIEMLKLQIENFQLQLSQKNTSVQKLSNQKLSNEEPDKAVEPKYKTPIEKYINIECKEAMTINQFVEYTKENFTLDDFKSIVNSKYEKKYIAVIKKMLETIPKKNMPIQIKTNKLNNEEGYIKTDDNFERYFRNELLTKFKMFIDGNKRNNLQNILQCLLSEYKESNNLSESENKYAIESLFGFEDNDNDSDIDRFPKKLLTLQRNILDLFMVNI
jgi:hypothetical protein